MINLYDALDQLDARGIYKEIIDDFILRTGSSPLSSHVATLGLTLAARMINVRIIDDSYMQWCYNEFK